MAVENPFDAYGEPDDDPSGLKPGPQPSWIDSFKENFGGSFSQTSEALHAYRAQRTITQAQDRGVAQPGASPFEGLPAQPEVDQAYADLDAIKQNRERYESFESPTTMGKVAGFVGGLGGGLAAPENMLIGGGVVASRVARGVQALGGSTALGRVLGGGLEAGGLNVLLDVPTQRMEMASGLTDHYDPLRTAIAFGLGAGLGSGMQGVVEFLGRRAPTVVPRTIDEQLKQPVPPEAPPTPVEAIDPGLKPEGAKVEGEPPSAAPVPAEPLNTSATAAAPAAEPVTPPNIGGAPRARFQEQPALGKQSVTARMSEDQIKADLGEDVPGTLLRPYGAPADEGIQAFHGTPHEFERFDASKIGTGEGAQAFGHGLYFAENEGVAKGYRDTLSKGVLIDGKPWLRGNDKLFDLNNHVADMTLYAAGGDVESAIKSVDRYIKQAAEKGEDATWRDAPARMDKLVEAKAELESLRGRVTQGTGGNLHEVRLNAKPEEMLDWDAPLSDQPQVWDKLPQEVKDAIDESLDARGMNPMSESLDSYTGRELYQALKHHEVHEALPGEVPGSSWMTGDTNEKVHTSKYLESLGIKGIRYLDGGSRRRGDGSRNYVVFNDQDVNIRRKNGVETPLQGAISGQFGPELKAAVTATQEVVDPLRNIAVPEQRAKVPTFDAAATPAPKADGAPAGVFMFDPTKLNVDAERFQFKSGGDEYGVTGALRSVSKWDPSKAQAVIVWESNDGKLYVADGHQRAGLARRLTEQGKANDLQLPGILFREKDGTTAEDIRSIAAVANIANGSGSAIDGAKVLRSRPDLLDGSLPLSVGKGKQSAMLARLDDEAFRMVVNEVVPENYGAIIGELIPNDGPRQIAAAKAVARFQPKNTEEAAALVQRVSQAELAKAEAGAQGSMFGDLETAESTAGQEMRIVGKAISDLKRDKTLFQRVVANAERIEQTGSNIERESAAGVATDAEVFARTLASDAYTAGPVRDALVTAAREVKNGTATLNDATTRILDALRRQAETERPGGNGNRGIAGQPDATVGRPGEEARPAGASEPTAAGDQNLIPGVKPVTDRDRIALAAERPMRGGNEEMTGGLFNPEAGKQDDMFGGSSALKPAAMAAGTPPVRTNPDSRFPTRPDLAGEAAKPRTLPGDVTPKEVQTFRVTTAMRDIAERLGRKLEVDGRFTIRNALGEYDFKDGVLRLRNEGDMEVFQHEVGHAADQRLATNLGADWPALKAAHANELRVMDANTTDPAAQTVTEGVAEFMRLYVTNPAYAQRQAPNFFDDFVKMVGARDPELFGILGDAARISQIDSGLAPTQVYETMLAPPPRRGLASYVDMYRQNGLGFALDRFAADAQAAIFGNALHVRKFVDELLDAQFKKTGKPMPRLEWDDPYKQYRMLPGASGTATEAIYYGPRSYFTPLDGPVGPSLYEGLAKAFHGDITVLERPDDPLNKAFNGYLLARNSDGQYRRWNAGDLLNPPVRASENETRAAVAEFEAAYPQFKEAADQVFNFSRAQRKREFEAGLIKKEQYDAELADNIDYIPAYRDMGGDADAGGGAGGAGGGFAGSSAPVDKQRKGSTRDVITPIHNLLARTVQMENLIAQNDVKKSLVVLAESGGEFSGRFLERIPTTELKGVTVNMEEAIKSAGRSSGADPREIGDMINMMRGWAGDDAETTLFRSTTITPAGERIMFMLDNGELAAFKVGNNEVSKAFFDTISQMNSQQRDLMFKTLGKANALFSQFIVNAPQFATKNLVMDNVSRIFVSRNTGIAGRIPGAAIAAGIWTSLFDREFARNYVAAGGIRGGVSSAAAREFSQGEYLRGVTMGPRSAADLLQEGKNIITSPRRLAVELAFSPKTAIEQIVKGTEYTETMGRLGQAKLIYNHLVNQGVQKPHAFAEAVYDARDILDYDLKGWAVQDANKFLVFLNPNLQGMRRANDVLLGDPLRTAIQAYKRGGYENLDGDSKQALSDAVSSWGMVALGVYQTYAYYNMSKDQEYYQRQSSYMKSRYYIFPGGFDEDGTERIVTMPKPFDLPGAILSTVELSLHAMRSKDPQGWTNAMEAFKDGILPRQFQSVNAFVSGNPFIKLGSELATGQKIPFDGGTSFPIVPRTLQSQEAQKQFTAQTNWLPKKMGEWFGVSPLVAEHVMNGTLGTVGRDVNTMLTATMGQNPNTTVKDAIIQGTAGGLYRRIQGAGGSIAEDFQKLVGTDVSKYPKAANSYRSSIEHGSKEDADAIYTNANDIGKAYITLQSSAKFTPEVRQMHPLVRANSVTDILNSVRRDLAGLQVEVSDKSRKRGQEREYIDIEPKVARAMSNTIGRLMFEEYRNGLKASGEQGYQVYPLVDTKPLFDAIRTLEPDVADEISKRLKKAHVLPFKGVAANWPEVQTRLLKDRQAARLGDLIVKARIADRVAP